ncbi:hypothetical protein AMJ83_02620 [candidate division WOR_3 bacterium SM23_42]|uniref:Secretion system C-terminal sorting domain-containing protein n=1 Tax=candidate division WOR_3 bacterium SM23_42 TaxID=1703779 RepID=A0A0S8FXE0_UNCW3|nr:MAG: hypothetical protein AMJ83_02620 [candidate division WOR_3 bacterium SM23_42]
MRVSKYIVVTFLTVILIWADWDMRTHNANQWELVISNFGVFGQAYSGNGPGGFWPIGSGHNYIYGAGFNVGAIKPNGDTVVTVGYGPAGGTYEYSPGIAHSNPYDEQWCVYLSTDQYYPLPATSLQDGYAVYNDCDSIYHMPDSFFVAGVTVTQKTHVWPIDWSADMIFMEYVVRNDTNYALNDLYVGIPMDFDIGTETGMAANDRCGLDLSRKMFYGWQETWEPGTPSWRPGMIGYKLLSSCSLSCYKRFTLAYEPQIDRELYLTMAGYNYLTGVYEPYDTVWPAPADQRIMMATGPFSTLPPGDSIVVAWVLIAGNDTLPPPTELSYKADKAQICYETGWHTVNVIAPNGGEVVTGIYNVNYVATSITGNPLGINLYLASPDAIDTIATGQSNTGSYAWNSSLWPDGVLYRIAVTANDTITFGSDISDGIFTIDNPGNTPPRLMVFTPSGNAPLSGDYDITWFARDAEFGDSLLIDIYFMSQYDTAFFPIALDEPNDSVYTWNTVPYRNGSGTLIIETHDEEFTVAETVQVYLLNQISGGTMDHIHGINNVVDLSALIHDAQQITGHTYELEFLEYRILDNGGYYYPEYMYEMRDSNTGVTVLDTYSLCDGYYFVGGAVGISDYSPIVDGFSIEAVTDGWPMKQINYLNDSVKIVVGTYPEDSIIPLTSFFWWAYRGARLQLDWVTHTSGGLSLLVTDLDYGDTIPFKPYVRIPPQNPDSAFGWCFHQFPPVGVSPSETLRVDDNHINLCGQAIRIAASVAPPQVGDRWIVYPSEYSPPIKGNLYRFTPTGIAEHEDQIALISFQVYPVPSIRSLTIAYNLPQRQEVSLTIYDVLGRQVRVLKNGTENPGQYKITWNGLDDRSRKVSAGVYFCRLETEDCKETKKFIVLK